MTGPKISSPAWRSVVPGRDDIGDGIGDPEADGGLDRAVERHEVDGDAALVEEAVDETGVRGRDPHALEIFEPMRSVPGGPAKRKVEPPKPSASISRAPGIRASSRRSRPVMPDVERAGPDVGRDVLGAEVEELDIVHAGR